MHIETGNLLRCYGKLTGTGDCDTIGQYFGKK